MPIIEPYSTDETTDTERGPQNASAPEWKIAADVSSPGPIHGKMHTKMPVYTAHPIRHDTKTCNAATILESPHWSIVRSESRSCRRETGDLDATKVKIESRGAECKWQSRCCAARLLLKSDAQNYNERLYEQLRNLLKKQASYT